MGGQSTATDLGSVVVLVPKAPELPGATDPPRHGVLWFLGACPRFTDRCNSWLHPCQQTAQTCTECDKESEPAIGRTRKGGGTCHAWVSGRAPWETGHPREVQRELGSQAWAGCQGQGVSRLDPSSHLAI